MKKPEVFVMKCGKHWVAWTPDLPGEKWVARSVAEVVGQLLIWRYTPGTYVLHALSDGERRIFPRRGPQTARADRLGAVGPREYHRKEPGNVAS